MNLGAGANRLRGSFFALTVPDLDNANVGKIRLLLRAAILVAEREFRRILRRLPAIKFTQ